MKKAIAFMSFVVVLTVMASFASAGDAIVMRGEVPFDFYVGDQLVPAGEYNFEMGRVGDATTDSVTVVAADGKVLAFAATRPGISHVDSESQLSFASHHGVRFLESVECPGFKADLKKAKTVLLDSIESTSVTLSH